VQEKLNQPPRQAHKLNNDGDEEPDLIQFKIFVDYMFNAIKD